MKRFSQVRFLKFENINLIIVDSEIHLEDNPPAVVIFEKPELKDALSWIFLSLAIFSILEIGIYITNPSFIGFGGLIFLVIIFPFFFNRLFLRKHSIGGESFRISKSSENKVTYKMREFPLYELKFEFITRRMNFGYSFLLFLISEKYGEIKLRSDYGSDRDDSITFKLANYLKLHLGLDIVEITENS